MSGGRFQSGYDARRNYAGRPKDDLVEVLKRRIPYEDVAQAVDELMTARDPKTVLYMVDRYAGRPAQAIQISGDEEKPLHALIGVEPRRLEALESPQDAPEALPAPVEGDGATVYLDDEPDESG